MLQSLLKLQLSVAARNPVLPESSHGCFFLPCTPTVLACTFLFSLFILNPRHKVYLNFPKSVSLRNNQLSPSTVSLFNAIISKRLAIDWKSALVSVRCF